MVSNEKATSYTHIYNCFIEAGIPVEQLNGYRGDLHVPVTPTTTAVLKEFIERNRDNEMAFPKKMPDTFKSLLPGEGKMYDIPFAYLPYWNKVAEKSRK